MRPEKNEAKAEAEAKKCEVEAEAEAKKNFCEAEAIYMRPRPRSQCLMNHAAYKYITFISHIIIPTSVKQN